MHSERALTWAIKRISTNGKLTGYPDDLVCYYKLPYLLNVSGQRILANHLLDYMKANFFKESDAITFEKKMTDIPLMEKFWGYVLGWIAIASQRLGRFDISYPAIEYLVKFQSKEHGGFTTSSSWGVKNTTMDVITTAQLGRLALYCGMKQEAIHAGQFLGWSINHQSDIEKFHYLFIDNEKKHIKDYPKDQEMIYVIKRNEPHQAYFMIGLPCAYLVELYNATGNELYLNYAKQYADFALSCHDSLKSFHYSHKVGWAASLLYRYTKDKKYLSLCQEIGEYLMEIQDEEGPWLKNDDAITSFDQSIENAIWLQEIAVNLS